jgi:ATP-dependent helicase/nuclease subunit A
MTAPALIDQRARQRIATALDENLCVEAAAGTGKTTVLVDRVVNLLAHTDLTVDQLVVITFTEKAAAELATRVRDRLEDEALRASGVVRDRLEVAARDLYRAHIETIHSFATALLRERPVEAELDPLFEVLEGLADSLDFDSAYERFQDELLSQPLPELERALRRGLGLRELREACQMLNEHRYLLELGPPAPLPDKVPETVAELRAIADELNALLAQHNPPGDDKAIASIVAIGEWVTELEAQNLLTQVVMAGFATRGG